MLIRRRFSCDRGFLRYFSSKLDYWKHLKVNDNPLMVLDSAMVAPIFASNERIFEPKSVEIDQAQDLFRSVGPQKAGAAKGIADVANLPKHNLLEVRNSTLKCKETVMFRIKLNNFRY
jgi:hypothetical protein